MTKWNKWKENSMTKISLSHLTILVDLIHVEK